MAAPETAIAFFDLVEKSQLLSPDQIAAAARQTGVAARDPAKDIALQFVQKGLLTRFQAERLLRGKYRGFLVGQYRLLEILGAGGMGMVYVAEDVESRQKVAVKLLSEGREQDAGIRARFEMEARAGIRLNHPNIVRTFHYARSGDTDYLVMEMIESITLQEMIFDLKRVPTGPACDFARQAAAALEHAHGRGLIHRDVKPANMLIDREGRVKILDFGLALLDTDDESEFSLARIFGQDRLGTADFTAPEQTLDSFTVDERADVYSLGCTLYNTLTGGVPFPYDSVSKKLAAHRQKKPKSIREAVSDVPAELEEIVLRMMSKRPEKRPGSMAEVQSILKPFAVREAVRFDFRRLLKRRMDEARRRAQLEKERSDKKRLESGSWATRNFDSTATPVLPSNPHLSRGEDAPASGPFLDQRSETPAGQVIIRHRQSGAVLQVVEAPTLQKANLSHVQWPGAALAGMDLREATLMHANLSGADLRGARLADGMLMAAVLKEADLREAALLRADLSDAMLAGCDLSRANFMQAKLRSAIFTGATARGADFSGADLSMAVVQANLRNANLTGADLRGANFAGADLTGATLSGAQTSGANFRGATGPDGKRIFTSGLTESAPAASGAGIDQRARRSR